jgi:hypothetical protein
LEFFFFSSVSYTSSWCCACLCTYHGCIRLSQIFRCLFFTWILSVAGLDIFIRSELEWDCEGVVKSRYSSSQYIK